jgi:4-amino-4-deoxy-L-arabinose transferase-like glycosyltransferase
LKPIYKIAILSFVLFGICFSSAFFRDLWEPDEPRFALVAKEMIESGNYIMPHRNKHPYPDKPPFFFWTIAASSKLTGGINTQAAILPAAIALAISIFLVFFIAKELTGDEKTAFWGAVIFATSNKIFWQGSHAQIDMVLSALIYGVIYCFLLHMKKGKHKYLIYAYALMGLATLTKGPVGFIIPLGSIITYKLIKKEPLKSIFSVSSILMFSVVVGGWLSALIIMSIVTDNMDYLNNILFKQTVVRFAKSWHHHQPVFYFFKAIMYDFFPWSLFLAGYIIKKFKEKRLFTDNLFAASWFSFTILFFSIPMGKRGLYILPLYPAAAVLVAQFFKELRAGSRYLKIPAVFSGILYTLIGIAGFIMKNKIESKGYDINLLPLSLVLVTGGITLLLKRNDKQTVRKLFMSVQIFLFGFVSIMVFPALNFRNSARQFVQENIKIMGKDATLALAQYRSAHVLYGDRNVIEFGGVEEEDTFEDFLIYLKETPNSFGIVKERSMENLMKRKEPVIVLNSCKVGSKKLYLITWKKGDNTWTTDNRP